MIKRQKYSSIQTIKFMYHSMLLDLDLLRLLEFMCCRRLLERFLEKIGSDLCSGTGCYLIENIMHDYKIQRKYPINLITYCSY